VTQSGQGTACSATLAGGFEARFAELTALLEPVFSRCDLRSNAESPRHHLIIRRKIGDPSELAFYIAYAPAHYVCSLTDLVRIARIRWAIEDDF
jgi:hypothetical protein